MCNLWHPGGYFVFLVGVKLHCEFHFDAPLLRHVNSPEDLVSRLLGNGLSVEDVLFLPFESRTILRLVLYHGYFSETTYGQLACDFAEHVLKNFETWNPNDLRPRNAIELSRQWHLGGVSEGELFDACHATKYSAKSARRAGHSSAASAANAAGAASDDGGNAMDASHFANLSGGDSELDWQVERIKTTLGFT